MPIADPKYFTKDHILNNRRNAPADLAELAVHSLELVSELVCEGLAFRFKGGNSLLILLDNPQRFSIDVDITTNETKERIDECVDKSLKKYKVFTRWQRRIHKTKPWLPMTSYEIYFKSEFSQNETFIMLDAVLKNINYPVIKKEVACGILYRSGVVCTLPSVSSIIGDKLLTLGVNTLGIPLGKNKEAQRLKHVFDIGLLLQKCEDIEATRKSIEMCIEEENSIQEKSYTIKEIYEDTMAFCRIPALFPQMPLKEGNDIILGEILKGIEPFASHLFSAKYDWSVLQLDTARAAFCFTAAVDKDISQGDFKKIISDIEESSENQKTGKSNSKGILYWKKIKEITGRNFIDC